MIRNRSGLANSYHFVKSPLRVPLFILDIKFELNIFRKKIWNRWYNHSEITTKNVLNYWIKDVNRLLYFIKKFSWKYLFKLNISYEYLHASNTFCLIKTKGLPLKILTHLKWKINYVQTHAGTFINFVAWNYFFTRNDSKITLIKLNFELIVKNYLLTNKHISELLFNTWKATFIFKYFRVLNQTPLLLNFWFNKRKQLTSMFTSKKFYKKSQIFYSYFIETVKSRTFINNDLMSFNDYNLITQQDKTLIKPDYTAPFVQKFKINYNLKWVNLFINLILFTINLLLLQLRQLNTLLLFKNL